jgi:hypothetical protein
MRRAAAFAGATLAAYVLVGRPRQLQWGATDHEATKPLPGDDLLEHADVSATRAVTIDATPAAVWPWIAQIGQGKGGFYSYDALENLMGCHIHSADRILPGHQRVEVGDAVHLHPEVALRVVACAPPRSLVVRGGVPLGDGAPPYDFTWAFVLDGRPDGTTRLLARERYLYTSWWAPLLVEPVEVASWVMSQKMLRGIRERAGRPAPPMTS